MVARGPNKVPSRPGVRPGDDAERPQGLQLAVHNACVYQRRVAAKGAAGGAQLTTRPRGPPVIGGVPAGMSRPPVNGGGGAPAGVSASWSSEIFVLQNG
jgi:hypothetical protein